MLATPRLAHGSNAPVASKLAPTSPLRAGATQAMRRVHAIAAHFRVTRGLRRLPQDRYRTAPGVRADARATKRDRLRQLPCIVDGLAFGGFRACTRVGASGHTSGFARAPLWVREGTRMGSDGHRDGLAQAPGWVRTGTGMGSRRHPGGFEQAPGWVRAGTMMGSRGHRGGFEQAPGWVREGSQTGSRRRASALAWAHTCPCEAPAASDRLWLIPSPVPAPCPAPGRQVLRCPGRCRCLPSPCRCRGRRCGRPG